MRLDVWLEAHEGRIGVLERAPDKSLTFTYDCDIPASGRISLLLPVRQASYADAACRAYFENLLFEGAQLSAVLKSYKIDRGDTGDLLFHLGADCPGAISITPEGTGPGKRPGVFPDDYDLLSDAELQRIVRSLHHNKKLPDENRDPSPLAGVQGKIAVVYKKGKYWLPKAKRRAPTTHILKVSPVDDPTLTRHESALLAAATAARLDTTHFQAKRFQDGDRTINALLVDRFDRRIQDDQIHRVHVEDLCQALGLSPDLKYERKSLSLEHRFSASAVGALAKQVSVPGQFMQGFLAQTLFNLMAGNTDNHGKNTSIVHDHKGSRLAPLYDVVPVFLDNQVTRQLAFNIGMAKFAEDVNRDNLLMMMTELGYGRPRFDKLLEGRLRKIAHAISRTSDKQGDKRLTDGLGSQMGMVAEALQVALALPDRDYFSRAVRDQKPNAGGWAPVS